MSQTSTTNTGLTGIYTTLTGCPVANARNSLTAGPMGPVVLQDTVLLEKVKQFVREPIPPRNVHALGTGAYGIFTVTRDISKYSMAKVFSSVGKKTRVFTRLSGTFTQQGEADTTRDLRGFSTKFYTEEGNWDLMAINAPVFNVKDAKRGPDAIHGSKRDPRTDQWNPIQFWDSVVNLPESLHFTTMLYTDKVGTPISFRHMHAWGCNTFSMINASKQRFFVKFHLVSQQGFVGLTADQAKAIAGEDPDWLCRDLFRAIQSANYPKWKLCFQAMPEEEAYRNPLAFDATKVWKHSEFPLMEIGELELNENPVNYFAEVEQVAFSPANVVPGISFSPDKLLQGRLLIYDDAQHHRIGPNFKQLPINAPKFPVNTPYLGGNMQLETKAKFPHYLGSSFGGLRDSPEYLEPPIRVDGPVAPYDYPGEGSFADYYAQPAEFYKNVLSDAEKQSLCLNIAKSVVKIPNDIFLKLLEHLYKIDSDFGSRVRSLVLSLQKGELPATPNEMLVTKLDAFLLSIKSSQ